MHLYVMDVQELVQLARNRVTRPWTLTECRVYLHKEDCPPLTFCAIVDLVSIRGRISHTAMGAEVVPVGWPRCWRGGTKRPRWPRCL